MRPKAAHVHLAHVHIGVQPPQAPRAAARPAGAADAGRFDAVAAAARAGQCTQQRALAGRAPVAQQRARLRAGGQCPGTASCKQATASDITSGRRSSVHGCARPGGVPAPPAADHSRVFEVCFVKATYLPQRLYGTLAR